jgi:glucose dehydrogenase
MTGTYDVVIVGAGFAGSIVALQLGLAGKRVLILESGPGFQAGASRQQYLQRFYTQLNKTPEAAYPSVPFAPRATTDDVFNHARDEQGRLFLKPGCTSYLEQMGPMPFSSTYERQAGGTGWHWLGTSLRMLPNDFRMATAYGRGVDWPLSYDDLAPYYCRAEYLIGVSADVTEQDYHGIVFPPDYVYPMQPIPSSVVDQEIGRRLQGLVIEGQALRVTNTPAARNSASNPKANGGKGYNNGRRLCAGNTACVPICPIQAKYDPTITLGEALQTGNVEILYQCVATNIRLDQASGMISGIDYLRYDDGSAPTPGVATGTRYVLAAHAIEAPKLLLNSNSQLPEGIANSSGQVGRNLMDHPVMNAWALMPIPVYSFRGPNSTSGIETIRDGEFRRTRGAFRIEINNDGWGWPTNAPYSDVAEFVDGLDGKGRLFGAPLLDALRERLSRQIDLNFLVEQLPLPTNRVTLSPAERDPLGIPRPRIVYELGDYAQAGFQAARRIASQIFRQLGASERTDFAGTSRQPNAFEYEGTSYLFQGAGHIVGTHRMGTARCNSVVDRNQRSWDHPNLFLIGTGVFPTIATSNPSLTLAALSLMAVETLLSDLAR